MSEQVGNPEDRFSHNEAEMANNKQELELSESKTCLENKMDTRSVFRVNEIHYICTQVP